MIVVSSTAPGLFSAANRLMEALKARLARLVSTREGCEFTSTGKVPHAAITTKQTGGTNRPRNRPAANPGLYIILARLLLTDKPKRCTRTRTGPHGPAPYRHSLAFQ